jgi:hypothetical protein
MNGVGVAGFILGGGECQFPPLVHPS